MILHRPGGSKQGEPVGERMSTRYRMSTRLEMGSRDRPGRLSADGANRLCADPTAGIDSAACRMTLPTDRVTVRLRNLAVQVGASRENRLREQPQQPAASSQQPAASGRQSQPGRSHHREAGHAGSASFFFAESRTTGRVAGPAIFFFDQHPAGSPPGGVRHHRGRILPGRGLT